MELQLKDVDSLNRLSYKDLLRVTRHIDGNFFTDECCKWKNYKCKGKYITFFHTPQKGIRRKTSLRRILWRNFVSELEDDDFLDRICNTDYCMNLNHFLKREFIYLPLYDT